MVAGAQLPFAKESNCIRSILSQANFNYNQSFVLNKVAPMKNILVCEGLFGVKIKPAVLHALLLHWFVLFLL